MPVVSYYLRDQEVADLWRWKSTLESCLFKRIHSRKIKPDSFGDENILRNRFQFQRSYYLCGSRQRRHETFLFVYRKIRNHRTREITEINYDEVKRTTQVNSVSIIRLRKMQQYTPAKQFIFLCGELSLNRVLCSFKLEMFVVPQL